MINVILVDDEPHCIAAMEEKIKLTGNVTILGSYNNAPEAIKAIKDLKPHAVFLDISMPQMDGFSMLNKFEHIDFEIIFTTAHNDYAIRAIRMSAFDFLLKPVGMQDLQQCLVRLAEKIKYQQLNDSRQQQLNQLLDHFHNPNQLEPKIALPTQNGLLFQPVKDIIRVEAESNYSFFYLVNGKKHVVSRTLKEFEDTLGNNNFFRVHKSHIVNLNYVSKYIKGDGGTLELTDGSIIEVSPSKKSELLSRLQGSK